MAANIVLSSQQKFSQHLFTGTPVDYFEPEAETNISSPVSISKESVASIATSALGASNEYVWHNDSQALGECAAKITLGTNTSGNWTD